MAPNSREDLKTFVLWISPDKDETYTLLVNQGLKGDDVLGLSVRKYMEELVYGLTFATSEARQAAADELGLQDQLLNGRFELQNLPDRFGEEWLVKMLTKIKWSITEVEFLGRRSAVFTSKMAPPAKSLKRKDASGAIVNMDIEAKNEVAEKLMEEAEANRTQSDLRANRSSKRMSGWIRKVATQCVQRIIEGRESQRPSTSRERSRSPRLNRHQPATPTDIPYSSFSSAQD